MKPTTSRQRRYATKLEDPDELLIDEGVQRISMDKDFLIPNDDGSRNLLYEAFKGREVDPKTGEDRLIRISTYKYSIESYEAIGFTAARAREMYSFWRSQMDRQDGERFFFFGVALLQLEDKDARHEDGLDPEPWRICMDRMGICKDKQDRILNPEFDDVRTTAACNQWLEDSIDSMWGLLEGLGETLRKRHRLV